MKIKERRMNLFVSVMIFFLLESYTDIIVFVQVLLPQPLQSAQPAQIELELVSKSIESWLYVPFYSLFIVTHVRVHACGIAAELTFIPNTSIHTTKYWTQVNAVIDFMFLSLQKYSTPFLLCNLENNGIILIANIVQNCSHCIIIYTGQKCQLEPTSKAHTCYSVMCRGLQWTNIPAHINLSIIMTDAYSW